MCPDYDAAELLRMDAGSWFGAACAGEPVPAFVDYAHYCKAAWYLDEYRDQAVPGFEAATGATVARSAAAMYAERIRHGGCPVVVVLQHGSPGRRARSGPGRAARLPVRQAPARLAGASDRAGAVAIHTNHKHLTAQSGAR